MGRPTLGYWVVLGPDSPLFCSALPISNTLGDCQLFGRGLPTVVGEASFDLCGDHQELGVGGLDLVVGGLHQG